MTDQDRKILAEQLNALIQATKVLQGRLYALEETLTSVQGDPMAQQTATSIADAWQDVCSAQMRLRAVSKRLTRQ
jgi:hypothetical protein